MIGDMSLRIKENVNPSLIIILSVILIISSSITITANNNNIFGTSFVIAYGNLNQTRS